MTANPTGPAAVEHPIVATVAATLRQIAHWGVARPHTDDEWTGLALQVEGIEPGWCCPLCQEIECDDDCPLAPLQLHRWPWTPPKINPAGSPHAVAGESDPTQTMTSGNRVTPERSTGASTG
jgi:hypothetical protein